MLGLIEVDKKKIIIIIAGVIFVLLGFVGIYFLFFYSSQTNKLEQVSPASDVGVGGLPELGMVEQGAQQEGTSIPTNNQEQTRTKVESAVISNQIIAKEVVADKTDFLDVNQTGSVRYYKPETGQFYKKLSDGRSVLLSDRQFNNVNKVTWSPGDKAVIEFPDGANIVYDFVKQQQYTLPSQLQEFAFNQSSDRLMAKVTGPLIEDNWLVTINSDGSGFGYVESMGRNGDWVQPLWSPNGMVGALFADSNGADSNTVVPIGLHGENYPSFNTVGRGFKGQWTEDGKKMLFTTYSQQIDFRSSLWLAEFNDDLTVRRQINLGLNTFLDKCTIFENRAYCAVPKNMPAGAGWFPELVKGGSDDIYEINFVNSQVIQLPTPIADGIGISVASLQYDKINNQLLLADANNGKIYTVNISD